MLRIVSAEETCSRAVSPTSSSVKNACCQTYLNLLRRGLVLSVADGAILLDDHGPPAVPVAHAGVPAVLLGEAGVAHEVDLGVRGAAVDLAPRAHDEGVIAGNDNDEVDTLGLKLVQVLKVGRDVEGLAARSESAGDRDEDDPLAGELLAGIVGLRKAAGGGVRVGDGSPAAIAVSKVRGGCTMQDTYSNLTSEGNLSPALRGAIVLYESVWILKGF